MRKSRLAISILILSAALLTSRPVLAGHPPQPLTIAQLQKLKKRPCTFITVWATWCSICMREMPEVVSWLAKQRKVHPVIIDVSEPYLQDQIAKKWRVLIDAPFQSYLKPDGNNAAYYKAIDPAYDHTLPFSALYHRGARKGFWRGALSFRDLEKAFARQCR